MMWSEGARTSSPYYLFSLSVMDRNSTFPPLVPPLVLFLALRKFFRKR